MTLRFRRVVDHLPSALAIDTKALESVDAHKVLGVTIQSNLKWGSPINEVMAKASKRLHIVRFVRVFVRIFFLVVIYLMHSEFLKIFAEAYG